MDPSRRGFIEAGLFSVALTIPGWPDVIGRLNAITNTPTATIGINDVTTVSKMTDRLSDIDDDFGGRIARPMAAAFLVNKVGPLLRANASEEIRRAMGSAAAFLCYLTGWMAVDEGLHGLAQQYYVKALELAGASDDHMTYCHVLRGMSVQAADLGIGPVASKYADAAAAASRDSSPRMAAFFAGQRAHSYALAGERSKAFESLQSTERAIQRAESGIGTFGGYSSATLAYHTSQLRYALGDLKGSIESMEEHFRLRQENDRQRTALLFGSILAERQLEYGHLEAACDNWNRILDDYPDMHSGRLDQKMGQVQSLLSPYRKNAAARQLSERVHEMTMPA